MKDNKKNKKKAKKDVQKVTELNNLDKNLVDEQENQELNYDE